MRHFVCIKSNKHCKAGQWFIADDVNEPLYKARLTQTREAVKLTQTSAIGIPFEYLAAFIVEPGFQIPRSMLHRKNLNKQDVVQEVADFQHAAEDIIEEEVERRGREANPNLPKESTIQVPKNYDADDS